MSAATRAKTAKARATIARKMIMSHKTGSSFPRSFDDCFEMGDGLEVVAELRRRAEANAGFKSALLANGFGYWFEEGYLNQKAGAA